ncbi:MAG: sensor histidine kinase [Armatimonadota bacterium]
MLTVPKDSVRFQVAMAVLVTILLSWVLSTGLANYINYLGMKSMRQQMLAYPAAYPQPMPEPTFGFWDFIMGRPPHSPRLAPDNNQAQGRHQGMGAPDRVPPIIEPGAVVPGDRPRRGGGDGDRPPGLFTPQDIRWVLLRLVIAISLAILAAVWLGRRLTRPLMQLADGARSFRSKNYNYRLPAMGTSEFSVVATAMNDMAQEVSQHISNLEEDARRQRQFLADVAHELRSPVTTMRTMAGALQDGLAQEPERRERAVSVLVRTSERMLRLVQEVMALVELDLDQLPVSKSEADLQVLVAAVFNSYEADAQQAGINLQAVDTSVKVKAMVDADRITQVLDNIVGNAISYAGQGATVRAVITDGDPVCVTISDNGVGIPAEHLPRILDSFYRVNAARSPGDNHIGLGLSLARRMVEAHGGKLGIESEQGKGTTVTVWLPK